MTIKLINCSGEPREFEADGFIYEFPFPSKNPTEVPEEVGKKLLETGQFTKFGEEKQLIEKNEYRKELVDLPKIGEKTAKDILKVFPSRAGLVDTVKSKADLPFDDDVSLVLEKHFGGS